MARSPATTIPRSFDSVKIGCGKITCFRENPKSDWSDERYWEFYNKGSSSKGSGYVSNYSKQKFSGYVANWIDSYQHYFLSTRKFNRNFHHQFTFVTLTLPAGTFLDDKELHKTCLKPFIQQLKRKHFVRNYLWRAEPQKNLRLHYHLLLDKSIDWRKLRDLWNGYMQSCGLIEEYKAKQLDFHKNGFQFRKELQTNWSYSSQLQAYQKGMRENWTDPNTTDIHKLQKVKNVRNYITKYMSKEDGTRRVGGRLLGCSDTLREVKSIVINLSHRFKNVIQQLAEEDGSEVFSCDFAWSLWRFDLLNGRNQYPVIEQIYKNFISHCVSKLYPYGVCTELQLVHQAETVRFNMLAASA